MFRLPLAIAALLAFATSGHAAEDSIADLVERLDAESFADRQGATESLEKRGAEAIPALAVAAQSESPEIATRAMGILKKHHDAAGSPAKADATAALQKLAAGQGTVATRAAEILKPKPLPVPQGANVPPGIRVAGAVAGLRIAVAAADGGGKRVTVKEADGMKTTEVTEKDRSITIVEDDKGIKLKVVIKKDGKEEAQEYAAKDVAELKEKHPEAHKLYEESTKAGEVRIAIGAVPGGFAPVPLPVVPLLPADARPVLRPALLPAAGLEKAQQKLDEAAKRLKALAENGGDEIKQALESVQQAQKELEALKAAQPK